MTQTVVGKRDENNMGSKTVTKKTMEMKKNSVAGYKTMAPSKMGVGEGRKMTMKIPDHSKMGTH